MINLLLFYITCRIFPQFFVATRRVYAHHEPLELPNAPAPSKILTGLFNISSVRKQHDVISVVNIHRARVHNAVIRAGQSRPSRVLVRKSPGRIKTWPVYVCICIQIVHPFFFSPVNKQKTFAIKRKTRYFLIAGWDSRG